MLPSRPLHPLPGGVPAPQNIPTHTTHQERHLRRRFPGLRKIHMALPPYWREGCRLSHRLRTVRHEDYRSDETELLALQRARQGAWR